MTADAEGEDDRPDPFEVIEAGRRRVVGPAAGLIAVAVISLGVVFLMAVQSGLMAANFARQQEVQRQQIDDNPTMTPAQKAQMKAFMGNMYTGMAVAFGVMGVTNLVAAVVIGLGAYRMLTVSGRGWGLAAAVVAMVPCFTGYAWVIGLPAGVWAVVTLTRPDVVAAFAAARRERLLALGADPD